MNGVRLGGSDVKELLLAVALLQLRLKSETDG